MLPRLGPLPLKERLWLLFLERDRRDVLHGAVVLVDEDGVRTHIPCGGVACRLVAPDTRVDVGDSSVRVRETIWRHVSEGLGEGNGVMAWSAPAESGFDFQTLGPNRRLPCDLDGVRLVSFCPQK